MVKVSVGFKFCDRKSGLTPVSVTRVAIHPTSRGVAVMPTKG